MTAFHVSARSNQAQCRVSLSLKLRVAHWISINEPGTIPAFAETVQHES
jgi:hypothetical protein